MSKNLMSKKKRFMHDIKIGSISFVGKAANKRVFPIFKSANADSDGRDTKEGKSEMNVLELLKEKLATLLDDPELMKAADLDPNPDADGDGDKDKEPDKGKLAKDADAKDKDQQTNQPDPNVAAILKAQQDTISDLKTEIAELRKQREADTKKQEEAEIRRIAKSFEFVPADENDIASMLIVLKENSEDEYKKALGVLQKMDRVIKSGAIFDVAGTPSNSLTKSYEDEVDRKLKEIKKSHPDMPDDEALVKVFEENPDLYDTFYENMPAAPYPSEGQE